MGKPSKGTPADKRLKANKGKAGSGKKGKIPPQFLGHQFKKKGK